MRTRRIEIVATLLALSLIGLAAGVAALRSRPAEPMPVVAAPEPPKHPAAAQVKPSRGAELYGAECAMCHRPSRAIDGAGRYVEPDSRSALIDLLLTGAVDGEEGAHPDSGHLADADIATLADYLVEHWSGSPAPAFTMQEVAARRP